jgi:tRNA A-37 threonylcarbamoyl transferase component Bud32
MTMEEFLRIEANASIRRQVLASLAVIIRQMHEGGLAAPDLFTRHIFVEGGSTPAFCLIDMARLDRRSRISARTQARDLAALNVTAPLRHVSWRERLRFLAAYGGDRRLLRRIEKRTGYLLHRRKFRDFLQPAEGVEAA